MEKLIITIARQYGSGGKTVGHMLAKELGIAPADCEPQAQVTRLEALHSLKALENIL